MKWVETLEWAHILRTNPNHTSFTLHGRSHELPQCASFLFCLLSYSHLNLTLMHPYKQTSYALLRGRNEIQRESNVEWAATQVLKERYPCLCYSNLSYRIGFILSFSFIFIFIYSIKFMLELCFNMNSSFYSRTLM